MAQEETFSTYFASLFSSSSPLTTQKLMVLENGQSKQASVAITGSAIKGGIIANNTIWNGAIIGSSFLDPIVIAGATIYPDIATGLANTTSGQYFCTPGPAPAAATLYRNVGGVAVLQSAFQSTAAIYVSSSSGLDTNTGLSPTVPVKTLAHAVTLLASGNTLFLKKGDDWLEPLQNLPVNITVDSYGNGSRPRIRGDHIISGTWVNQGPGNPNVWQLTVTPTYNIGGSIYWPIVWDQRYPALAQGNNGNPLTPYFAGASIAAAMTFVNANPGTFLATIQGSTNANIQSEVSQAANLVLNIHLSDGANPNTISGLVLSFTEWVTVGVFSSGDTIQNLTFMRTAHKDFTHNNSAQSAFVQDCDFLGAVQHGTVCSGLVLRRCYFETAIPSLSQPNAGGGVVLFQDTAAFGTDFGVEIIDCEFVGFSFGIVSHGTGGVEEHPIVRVHNVRAVNCAVAISTGFSVHGWWIRDFYAVDCEIGFQCDTEVDFYGELFFSYKNLGVSSHGFAFQIGQNTVVHDGGVFIADKASPASNCFLFRNDGFGLSFPTLTLNNIRNFGCNGQFANAGWQQVNLVTNNCILGAMSDNLNSAFCTTFTATNTQFSWGNLTLAQAQALQAGIANSCLVPFVSQSVTYTVQDGDITYQSNGWTATATHGTTSVTVNSAKQLRVGTGIKIAGAGAGGGVYTGIIQTDPSSGTFTVSPAIGTDVASAAMTVAGYNAEFFADTTAQYSGAGGTTYQNVINLNEFGAGLWVYIGGAGRQDVFGLAKVSSTTPGSPNALNFDRVTVFRADISFIGGYPHPTLGAPGGDLFQLRFSNPFVKGSGVATVNKGGLGTITYNDTSNGLWDILAEVGGAIGNYLNAVGGPNTPQIDHVAGTVNAPFMVNSGDVLTVTVIAYVQELDAYYQGYPPISKRCDPVYTCEAARLGMGENITR